MRFKWVVLVLVLLSSILSVFSQKSALAAPDVQLHTLETPSYKAFYVIVPSSPSYRLLPVVSPKLQPLANFTKIASGQPIVAINAGFFDPENHKTTSYVTQAGVVIADPKDNKRFMDNPALVPYLPKILNRSELRIWQCGDQKRYAVEPHLYSAMRPGCTFLNSLQAGPNLFYSDSLVQEGFLAYEAGHVVRDPIGVFGNNARSAVGVSGHGDLILAMVAMKPKASGTTGASLSDMSNLMRQLGAVEALSLDGGSSTSLWYNGKTYYGKLDKSKNWVKRPIKSALIIVREE